MHSAKSMWIITDTELLSFMEYQTNNDHSLKDSLRKGFNYAHKKSIETDEENEHDCRNMSLV